MESVVRFFFSMVFVVLNGLINRNPTLNKIRAIVVGTLIILITVIIIYRRRYDV